MNELSLMTEGESVLILEDNQACRLIASDAKHHSRAKHIDVQYHFARECNQDGKTLVKEVHTQRQLADYLTKYVNTLILKRLTLATFGYDKHFHFQPHNTTMTSMNTGSNSRKKS